MISEVTTGDFWMKWLETQGPLWVVYGLVVTAIIRIAGILFTRLPIIFDKHCVMLDTATKSMADSATSILLVNSHVEENKWKMIRGQKAIAEAASPACKALLLITPPERKDEVKEHLDEVIKILSKPLD